MSLEVGFEAESARAHALKCLGSSLPAEIPKNGETNKISYITCGMFLAPIVTKICEPRDVMQFTWVLVKNFPVVQCF